MTAIRGIRDLFRLELGPMLTAFARVSSVMFIVVLASLVVLPQAVAGVLDRTTSFDIKAANLAQALLQLGTEAHVQIVFATKAASGRVGAEELHGTYELGEALRQILRGTGLEYIEDGNRIEIIPKVPRDHRSGTSSRKAEDGATGPERNVSKGAFESARERGETNGGEELPALRQVIVTGTHIADVEPTAPVAIITSKEISDSGLPDVASVIRALPQFYSGGQNPDAVVGGGINGGTGISDISTANLRGIGAHATLTLLDGRELAGSGADDYVDISSIPTAAVKRVEIETGGASAIYGADAVAGVVDVVLKKDYEGEDTDAYVGGTLDGGLVQRYSQTFGRRFARGAGDLMLGYQYQDTDEILADQRSVARAAGSAFTIQPQEKSNALFLSAHFEAADSVRAHVEGFYNHRTSLNRFDGTEQQAVEDQFAVIGGVTAGIGDGRTASLDLTSSGDSAGSLFYAPQTPPYARESVQNRVLQLSFTEQGPLVTLPGRRIVRSAVGAGFARESFDAILPPALRAGRRREHAYVELNIPVVPGSMGRPGLERLTISAAGRFQHYSQFGSVTVPKVGIAYSAVRSVRISATWGRSFQTPTLGDLYLGQFFTRFPGSFFGLPAGRQVLFVTGSNPDLQPQTATTRTMSVRWEPRTGHLRGVRLGATYYDIDFSHVINVPITNLVTALRDPLIAPFIVETPSASVQSAAEAEAELVFNPFRLPENPDDVQALVYNNSHNLSEEVIHGIDGDLGYGVDTNFGRVTVDANASWERFDRQLIPGAGLQEIAGTVFNPAKLRGRIMFGWTKAKFGGNLFVNYVSGELNTAQTPAIEEPSWTTVDAQIRYRLAHVSLRLSVQNLLDRAPPGIPASSTVPPGIGFDADNYSAVGRVLAAEVSTDWGG